MCAREIHTLNLQKLASLCLKCGSVALSGFCSHSSGLPWSAYTAVAHLLVGWIAAVYIIWLLHTWRGNIPPLLIVTIKHTFVKYPHYCISVYTYILIQVDTSEEIISSSPADGSCHRSLSLCHFLHPFPSYSHSLSHSRCSACCLPVLHVCVCARTCWFLFVHGGNVSVIQCEQAYFASEIESQVVTHV